MDRDEIARAIDPGAWRYFDTGMFPPEHPASIAVVRTSREAADRVLTLLERGAETQGQGECDHVFVRNAYYDPDPGRVWRCMDCGVEAVR